MLINTVVPVVRGIPFDHISASFTLDIGDEETIATIRGRGHANVLFKGDGSATLKMRVYVDETLDPDGEFPANTVAVGTYNFLFSIEIRVYNPTDTPVVGSSSTFNLRGVIW